MMHQSYHQSYYAIIPANVRYSKDIPDGAKLLYAEITALATKEGYCWATNHYFAELYEVSEKTIQRWLKALSDASFIRCEIFKQEGNKRHIYIANAEQSQSPYGQNIPEATDKNVHTPMDKNVPYNNRKERKEKKRREKRLILPLYQIQNNYRTQEGSAKIRQFAISKLLELLPPQIAKATSVKYSQSQIEEWVTTNVSQVAYADPEKCKYTEYGELLHTEIIQHMVNKALQQCRDFNGLQLPKGVMQQATVSQNKKINPLSEL